MKKELFCGVGTALVTPFKEGKIDYAALSGLIEMQIEGGVSALIIGGTTGEAATLSDDERYSLFEAAREFNKGRVALIFGTGTNDTRVAIKHTKMAEKIGCDGVLLVTPYYNKGTPEGIYRHYESILQSTSLPAILYNVPSRTGVNIDIASLKRLSFNPQVVGIKEASGSLSRLISVSGIEGLPLYSGNDSETYVTLSLGGRGIISVISNIYPKEMSELCKQFFAGDCANSLRIQRELLPFMDAMFIETNPTPLKYVMSRLGLCEGDMRLPLSEVSEVSKDILSKLFKL